MATPNPMANTYPIPPLPVSKKTFYIAGIVTTVYGFEELDARDQSVACLWLLHPRLQTQESMAPVAASTINAWREEKKKPKKEKALGLICVSFDQRNHGSREVNAISNEAWRNGNKTHAQDMFASYRRCRFRAMVRALTTWRRNCHGHIPPDELHLRLHLSNIRAYDCEPFGIGSKPWRSCWVALHNA